MVIIPKNSENRIAMLGSFISPSIRKPMVVIIADTVRMFESFLFIV
jgi:hypothetical protein